MGHSSLDPEWGSYWPSCPLLDMRMICPDSLKKLQHYYYTEEKRSFAPLAILNKLEK